MASTLVSELIGRSNRLGARPRDTDHAGGRHASRAAVHGVLEEELGSCHAQRTLLGREVLPDRVADAVLALTGGDLSRTAGLHDPVDSGVAAARR